MKSSPAEPVSLRSSPHGAAGNHRRWIAVVLLGAAAGLIGLFPLVARREQSGPRAEPLPVVGYLKELEAALAARKVDLVVLAMPYGSHVLGDSPPRFPAELAKAKEALTQLADSGVKVIDLFDVFQAEASLPEHWRPDRFHLMPATSRRISPAIHGRLAARGFLPGPNEGSETLLGDCFADTFGTLMRKHCEGRDRLRILSVQGDRGRIANHLFLFAGQYLEGTGRVYWLMSYSLLASKRFPPLVTRPETTGSQSAFFTVDLLSAPGWKGTELNEKLRALPYRNAVIELAARITHPKDQAGRDVILMGYGALNRRAEPLLRAEAGSTLNIRATEYDAYLLAHPEVATECVIPCDAPLDLPRYWIEDWSSAH